MKIERGFTLIELMIAVGIISILAAVAIPAFNRYLINAKAAEAPILLGVFSEAEIAFFTTPRKSTAGEDLPPCFLSVRGDGMEIWDAPPKHVLRFQGDANATPNAAVLGWGGVWTSLF